VLIATNIEAGGGRARHCHGTAESAGIAGMTGKQAAESKPSPEKIISAAGNTSADRPKRD